ncbi:MAG: prepilin-type N-terminal cleavage/methylation domain-containing protein [Candidatus Cohnella colombiensis]|uniref:Prepilin-type N-terminal cleavage/methylation domain-containing protein n=1 Tax=Candidatus Cohnella colombiensis TaxID=3121368 RepID=A0AA95EUZ1_9BACL|nr:MAG: prepilin-type N-terminal cleavage/methylation domain-containing protein [Cohnella sp.]
MRAHVLKRLSKEQKGFTLIELLAVIVILGIIAAIAVPMIGNIIDKSKKDSDIAALKQIYDASRLYVTTEANGDFKPSTTTDLTVSISELQSKGFLDASIVVPSTKDKISGGNVVFQHSDGALLYISITTGSPTAVTKYYKGSDIIAGNRNAVSLTSPPTTP